MQHANGIAVSEEDQATIRRLRDQMIATQRQIEEILSKYLGAPFEMTLPPHDHKTTAKTFTIHVAPKDAAPEDVAPDDAAAKDTNPWLRKSCGCYDDPPGVCYPCKCGGPRVGDMWIR